MMGVSDIFKHKSIRAIVEGMIVGGSGENDIEMEF